MYDTTVEADDIINVYVSFIKHKELK